MGVYYVTHPNIGVSATVYAPSTEKARTVFLDYLERKGSLPRAYRSQLRKDMVAEGISDPYSILSDVELHYGYAKEPASPRVSMEEVFKEQPITKGEPTEVQEYDEALGMAEPEPSFGEEVPLVEERPKRMPIQEVALGGSL